MLTEAEKKWLEERTVESCAVCKSPIFYCVVCTQSEPHGTLEADMFSFSGLKICPTAGDYQDASEFEARVAAKLATMTCDRFCQDALNNRMCRRGWADRRPMYACRLKHARLAVEEEMEHGSAL